MPKLFFFCIITIICISCKQSPAKLVLSSYSFDFEEILQDSIYHGNIKITNTGEKKLKIGSLDAGCGCTKAYAEKYELGAKESCTLYFSYDTTGKKKGKHEELIIINTNTDSLFHILQITAFIQ